jgi:hypothetical protein
LRLQLFQAAFAFPDIEEPFFFEGHVVEAGIKTANMPRLRKICRGLQSGVPF